MALLVGLAILGAVAFVPFLNVAITLLSVVFGVGAIAVVLGRNWMHAWRERTA